MTKTYLTSGDAVVDRRSDYCRMLADNNEFAAAAELMEQALELAPDWPAGWHLLGDYHEKAGNEPEAIAAWRRLEALDDDGRFGAALKLASHGSGPAGTGTAVSYVEALFDQYAPRFDATLLDKLGYQVPEQLAAMLAACMAQVGIAHFAQALDLGCGTGLMGERVRAIVGHLEGVDISAAMIAQTRRKGIYDRLAKAELVSFLQGLEGQVDLITAADVLIYCGALPPIADAMSAVMASGALLAFSLEAHYGPEPVFLLPSLRYAHNGEGVVLALAEAGLNVLRFETATLRYDRGQPIVGFLVVAQKP